MNDPKSRRDFLGIAAAGVAGIVADPTLGVAQSRAATSALPDPDLVVYNAKVYTVDNAAPRAEAFAIAGGRFVGVGSSAEMRALARARTQLFDAKQMTIVPGCQE